MVNFLRFSPAIVLWGHDKDEIDRAIFYTHSEEMLMCQTDQSKKITRRMLHYPGLFVYISEKFKR